ncbi:MAG: diguanylate cyclase, partial [Gemmatimonadota bacterium]|nr:diguanylate cyclase [Gemmatimonadota bacterium]
MTLRNQLLSYFSAVILAVVALFGWNAYRIASGATERQRDALVVEHVGQLARALSVVDPEGMDAARLDAVFATSAEVGYAVAVVGPQGTAVMRKSLDPRIGEDLDQVDLAAIAGSPGAQGTLRVADHAYEWASAAIPGTPYLLVYVFPEGDGLRYSGLASRMIALALFMGWISVWVALVISTKVSDRLKAQSDEIERQATHDALTGLPNRLWILRRLEQEIARQPDSGRKLAMITMDLNRFKVINNTLGHDVGDALIQEVGKTLQDSLWESDGLARTGGDEFALLMPIRDEAHCYLLMDKIVGALEGPVVVGGITLEVSVSLGTAVYPAHGDDAASLIRCAEVAMYSAKEEGVPYAIYDPESDPNSVEHLMLISDLRQAEDLDQLELHYQPKVSVGTGRVEGVEALLRWSHPERGSVSPANFITLAEQSGAIKDLTEWVLDTAIEQAAAWRDQGHDLRVSVNLSARVLRDMDLPST